MFPPTLIYLHNAKRFGCDYSVRSGSMSSQSISSFAGLGLQVSRGPCEGVTSSVFGNPPLIHSHPQEATKTSLGNLVYLRYARTNAPHGPGGVLQLSRCYSRLQS